MFLSPGLLPKRQQRESYEEEQEVLWRSCMSKSVRPAAHAFCVCDVCTSTNKRSPSYRLSCPNLLFYSLGHFLLSFSPTLPLFWKSTYKRDKLRLCLAPPPPILLNHSPTLLKVYLQIRQVPAHVWPLLLSPKTTGPLTYGEETEQPDLVMLLKTLHRGLMWPSYRV